ncbi:Asparagine synthetase [glutamine-hydrolyzing] 1 [Leptolyngbya sp. O-77]|nr:Asparagine synthetase [glutamine-hydrolyzing] 1 [Leptolyngbya sp. O-77]
MTHLQPDGSLFPDAWVRLVQCPDGSVGLELGRDRFGRVPLYWQQQQQVLWFSSRLQLLLAGSPIDINAAALHAYTCFSYVPTPLTPVQGIQAVPAGMQQTWQLDETGTLQWAQGRSQEWQEAGDQIDDEPTAVRSLQTLLKDSICRQTADLKDEPVGVLLSGGLDSSIVAALLVQLGVRVTAYSLDFGVPEQSELDYARCVADYLSIPLVTVDASAKRIRRAIAPTAAALDLPFGDGVTVPLFLLKQRAAQDTSVIFNGEHGDQLFAGWTNKPLIAAGVYSCLAPNDPSPEAAFYQQYLKTFHRLAGYEHHVFQPDFLTQHDLPNPVNWLREALDPQFSTAILHRLRRANLMLKGAQNIQPRATALAFAHGLRVRSPFCDVSLAEWTFRLSNELCLQGSCEKYILKRAVENWLPPEIVWRTKRGMGVPLTLWCFNDLWHDLGLWLNPAVLQAQAHLQPDIATRIVSGSLGGPIQGRRIGECLWLLLMWQAWRKAMLKEADFPHSWNHPFWLPAQLWRRLNQWQNS